MERNKPWAQERTAEARGDKRRGKSQEKAGAAEHRSVCAELFRSNCECCPVCDLFNAKPTGLN